MAAWQGFSHSARPGRPRRNMQDCKCSSRLARLYQLVRLLQTPVKHCQACHEQELNSLSARLHVAQQVSRTEKLQYAQACIAECKRDRAEREQLAQKQRLKNWRIGNAQSIRALSSWIKSKECSRMVPTSARAHRHTDAPITFPKLGPDRRTRAPIHRYTDAPPPPQLGPDRRTRAPIHRYTPNWGPTGARAPIHRYPDTPPSGVFLVLWGRNSVTAYRRISGPAGRRGRTGVAGYRCFSAPAGSERRNGVSAYFWSCGAGAA